MVASGGARVSSPRVSRWTLRQMWGERQRKPLHACPKQISTHSPVAFLNEGKGEMAVMHRLLRDLEESA